MLYKEDLKPFWKKNIYLLPITSLIVLILSPVLLPVSILYDHREEIIDYYKELLDVLFLNIK